MRLTSVARAPWAHAVSDELNRVRSAGASTVRLCYVGITVASTPLGRISHDLDGDDPKWTHFVNYADVIQKVRSQHAKPAALWEIYEFQHGRLPCTVLELRRRAELQAAERAVIAAYEGLGLNSAAGGFHHLPEYLACQPDEPSWLLHAPAAPIPDETIAMIRRHFVDSRRLWRLVPDSGPDVTDVAFEAVVSQASTLRSVGNGYTLSLMIGKDITHEAVHSIDPDLAMFYGTLAGPGPALSLFLRVFIIACGEDITRGTPAWVNLVGGFVDFWSIVLVHLLVWLSAILLIRYLRIVRPLFIRVQSSKVSKRYRFSADEPDLEPRCFWRPR